MARGPYGGLPRPPCCCKMDRRRPWKTVVLHSAKLLRFLELSVAGAVLESVGTCGRFRNVSMRLNHQPSTLNRRARSSLNHLQVGERAGDHQLHVDPHSHDARGVGSGDDRRDLAGLSLGPTIDCTGGVGLQCRGGQSDSIPDERSKPALTRIIHVREQNCRMSWDRRMLLNTVEKTACASAGTR
jgi:hypothetical protein